MILSSCLIAVIACVSSQTQSGIEQFEGVSKRAQEILSENGSGRVSAEFDLIFKDVSMVVERATSKVVFAYSDSLAGHTKYKVIAVSANADGYLTKVLALNHFIDNGQERQQNAELSVQWDAALSTHVIAVDRCVQVAASQTMFTDVSAQFFNANDYDNKLAPGLNYWQKHIAASLGLSTKSHQGISIADVNGNGFDDIYLPQPAGLPNTLLTQVAEGVFEDHSVIANLDFLDASRSALFVDFDNDGDLDLATTFPGVVAVFSNDGKGVFSLAGTNEAAEVTSLAAADIDQDGLVDVYACRYLNPYDNQAVPQPYNDANNGLDNLMLRNFGDLVFKDVTTKVGLDVNNMRFSFAASFEDYDNDGDQDLYVANDYGRNNLYRNDGGKFVDVAAAAGVEDISAGMAVSWGDYDNDGFIDLYVSNMYSSAGQRITYQRDFMQDASEQTRAQMQRHAGGNTLFKNMGDGTFKDMSQHSETAMGRWAWGSIFFDFNNDSLLDIFVPNGFTTNDEADDL
ncbi:MAG: VCBS repeat-containing protein [Planctomycetes bacterium]|nr:VCBS repeat-containing protein [Planctomycetota bacterium]